MAVVDASVVTAVFKRDDVGHVAAAAWLRAMLQDGGPIVAPAILLAEVGSAIRRNTGDPVLARAVVDELCRMPGLSLVPVSDPLARRGAQMAAEHALRGCDALYVATAEQYGDALVTLDEEQLGRGAAVVRTMRPDDASR